jgi:hypothetical protein
VEESEMSGTKVKKSGKPRQTKVAKSKEVDYFVEALKTDEGDHGVILDTPGNEEQETEFYTIKKRGKHPQVLSDSNEKERLAALWAQEAKLDKSLWRDIRFNVSVQNPMREAVSFQEILDKMKTEKINSVFHDHSILQRMDHGLWKIGDEVCVPPGVAKYYTGIRYDMGYEGLGNVTNVRLGGKSIERQFITVASYIVDHIGE